MIDRDYLSKGLCALARAHRANTMAGHLGAALVAGYWFGQDHRGLDARVYAAIEGELDRIVAGDETWFDASKVGMGVPEMFEPMPDAPAQPEQVGAIAEALSRNIDKLRQSGHNAIFAALAVRALRENPHLASQAIVSGVCKLIEGFNDAGAGRQYFGKDRGWVQSNEVALPADDAPPPYADLHAMAEVTIDELIHTASEHRQGCGGLWHIVNHAAALADLSRCGWADLAARGFEAHRTHIRLWRTLPDLTDELGPLKLAAHDPRTPAFWSTGELKRDSARLTHRIKTLYGFFTLVRLVDDPAKREAAEQKLLYLMA